MTWGTIRSPGFIYRLTDDDMLWAARMLEREGPVEDSPAVLWTMAQLFSPAGQKDKYGRPDRFSTFKDLIRAYSQPINPKWYRDGACCRPGSDPRPCPKRRIGGVLLARTWYNVCTERGDGRRHCPCSESKLRARAALATKPWEQLDPQKREVLTAWAKGGVPNPVPKAIEFADRGIMAGFVRRHPGGAIIARIGNWYGATAGTMAWPDGLVWISTPPHWAWFVGAGLFLTGGVVYGLHRWGRL